MLLILLAVNLLLKICVAKGVFGVALRALGAKGVFVAALRVRALALCHLSF